MKKLLLVLLSFTALSTYGQFTKGTRTVGLSLGNITYSNLGQDFDYGNTIGIKGNKQQNFSIALQPSMGWFLTEKLIVGGNISLNFFNSKFSTKGIEQNGNSYTLGIGGFSRYFFTSSGFMPYAQAGIGIGFGNGSGNGSETGTTSGGIAFSSKYTQKQKGILNIPAGVAFGVTKMVNKNVGLDVGIGYQFTSTSYKYSVVEDVQYINPPSSEQKQSNYKYSAFNHNAALSVGVIVFLDSKK